MDNIGTHLLCAEEKQELKYYAILSGITCAQGLCSEFLWSLGWVLFGLY